MTSSDRNTVEKGGTFHHPSFSLGKIIVIYALLVAGMIAWHATILTAPPYDDFACVFLEAVWLAENDFDYSRLRNEELPFRRGGGPVIYLTSAVPSFFALLIRYGPGNPANLVLAHLVMLALASLILLFVFLLVRMRASAVGAILVTGLLATHPLFQSQSEMLGVDVPMTAMAIWAVYLTARGRFSWAVFAAAAAFAMKPTGLVVAVALAGYFFLRVVWTDGGRRERRNAAAALFWVLTLLATEWWVLRWSGIFEELDHPVYAQLKPYFPIFKTAPDLVVVPLMALAAFAVSLVWPWVRRGQSSTGRIVPDASAGLLCAAIAAGVLFGVFYRVQLPVPRYFLLALAASVVLLGHSLPPLLPRLAPAAFAIGIGLNLANSSGWLYPSLERLPCSRIGAIWERSLEYRHDLSDIRNAIRAIEERRGSAVVVAPHHWTHPMAIPELGYVTKSIPGFATSEYTRTDFPPVAMMLLDRPRDVIFVAVDNLAGTVLSHVDIPPPDEGDEVLYPASGTAPVSIHRKRLPRSNTDYDQWCLDHLFHGRPEALDRSLVDARSRAEILDGIGRADLGTRLLEKNLARDPENPDRLLDVAEQKLLTSVASSARPYLEQVRAKHPGDTRSALLWARLLADTGSNAGAIEELDAVVREAPARADAWYWKGVIHSRRGQYGEARQALQRAGSLDPFLANVDVELAKVEIRDSKLASAAHYLTLACRRSPYEPGLHYLRAAVLSKLSRQREAKAALATAARLDPSLRRASPSSLPDPLDVISSDK